MDAGKLFVLIATILAVGVLAYLELKSRRSRQQSQASPANTDRDTKKTPGTI
jgi:uncharacterized membrane protein YebE (DUF533 family)